jgi:hypothetical protein
VVVGLTYEVAGTSPVLAVMGAAVLGKPARRMQHLEPLTRVAEVAVLLILLLPLLTSSIQAQAVLES